MKLLSTVFISIVYRAVGDGTPLISAKPAREVVPEPVKALSMVSLSGFENRMPGQLVDLPSCIGVISNTCFV